jgi:hypothetical protein
MNRDQAFVPKAFYNDMRKYVHLIFVEPINLGVVLCEHNAGP